MVSDSDWLAFMQLLYRICGMVQAYIKARYPEAVRTDKRF